MSAFFNTYFYEPILNGLVYILNYVPFHDVGLAVIVLTIIVRIVIFPLNHHATVTQKKIKDLEPELKEVKEKYKDSKDQSQKIMDLYKQHGINPLSLFSIFALFLQIPIFFAMYKAFAGGINFDQSLMYSFVHIPEIISKNFLGFIDVTQKGNYILAALAGVSQFIQINLAMPPVKDTGPKKGGFKEELARSMGIQMRYFMPVLIFFIATRLPAAMSLYWLTMNVFSIAHEYYVRRKAQKMVKS